MAGRSSRLVYPTVEEQCYRQPGVADYMADYRSPSELGLPVQPSAPPMPADRQSLEAVTGLDVAAAAAQASVASCVDATVNGLQRALVLNLKDVQVNGSLQVYMDSPSPQQAQIDPNSPGQVNHQPPAAAAGLPSPDPATPFVANDPVFHPCYSPEGVDFGMKFLKRFYKAEKHEDPERKMLTYCQCSSTVESISHFVTAHKSNKRTKVITFMFDDSAVNLATSSNWPPVIHFPEIKSLVEKLGASFEYCREKVRSERFSLYLFFVKRTGTRLSENSRQTWSNVCQWSRAHETSPTTELRTEGSAFAQVLSQVVANGIVSVSGLT